MDGWTDGWIYTHTHTYTLHVIRHIVGGLNVSLTYLNHMFLKSCINITLYHTKSPLNVVTVVTKKRCLQGIRYPSTSLRRSTSAVKAPHVLMPMARRGKQKTSGSLVQLLMGAKIWGGLGFNVF